MSAAVKSLDEALRAAQQGKGKPAVPAAQKQLVIDVREWLADSAPPVWLVEGIIQRGMLYAVTAITNHGKTAITLLMAVAVGSGLDWAGHKTTKAGVLILCGENPDGFRTRMRATLQAVGVEEEELWGHVKVLPYSVPLRDYVTQIREEAKAFGVEYGMVLIDTSPSFFSGDSEDDNMQALHHALDMRVFHELPGKPAVIANCHPTKGADQEHLVPRGGGAFLNEIDTNLTVWAEEEVATFHWATKKRGPDFEPIAFEFHGKTMVEGEHKVPTVVALPISEERAHALKKERRERENRVLYAMLHHPGASYSTIAGACGWDPGRAKSRINRIMKILMVDALVAKKRGSYVLTKAGEAEARMIT